MNKGFKHSEETKQKMSKAQMGNKKAVGSYRSKEFRQRLRESNLGKKLLEETKRKLSEAHKGKKNPNWQGGKSFEPYTTDWTQTLKRSIRERDNYVCQLCKKLQGDRAFCVHHRDYNKKNCDPNNLITLCVQCNSMVNYNRNYWIDYFIRFSKIVSNKI